MAPTVSELGERRRPFSLEEYLHACLRIKDGLRANGRHQAGKKSKLGQPKGCKGRMVLVVDESSREGDSPSLPPSSPVQPHHANSAAISPSSASSSPSGGGGYSCSQRIDKKQGLVEISLKTMALLRRNQQLQRRLTALQMETRAFVKAALNENGGGDSQPSFHKPSK